MTPRRKRVLVLSELPEPLRERLGAACDVVARPSGVLDEAAVAALAAETAAAAPAGLDGLLTLLIHPVGERVFAAAPDLVIVANCAVGLDNVDLAAARRRGVTVTHTPDVLTDDTADLTWALLLAVARRLVEADRAVRAGRFDGWRPDGFLGRALAGSTLGVVGAGRIGRAVLGRAAGFGIRRIYASRSALPAAVEAELGAERRALAALLAEADFVSLHLPLTADTHHLIDADAFAAMKPGSFLVNTSRGAVVDEAALAAALGAGHLAGAGLDVYEHEPAIHPDLLTHPGVVLAPHIGSATVATRTRMAEMCVQALIARLTLGRRPAHAV
jgi:glyoxylate reductase